MRAAGKHAPVTTHGRSGASPLQMMKTTHKSGHPYRFGVDNVGASPEVGTLPAPIHPLRRHAVRPGRHLELQMFSCDRTDAVGAPTSSSDTSQVNSRQLSALTSAPRFASLPDGMQNTDSSFDAHSIELRRQIEELEGYPAGGGHEKELERLRVSLRKTTADDLRRPQPVAEDPRRPPPGPPLHPRLRRGADDRLGRAPRRPRVRRTIRPSSPASPTFRGRSVAVSDTRRGATPRSGSAATSASRGRRATARRCAS